MSREEKIKHLNYLCWDIPYNGEDLLAILENEPKDTGLTKFNVYNKIMQGIRWYTILDLLNEKQLNEALQDEVLNSIFPKSYQQKYHNVKRLYSSYLYPLQDKVLKLLDDKTPFYLTGGTTLSRIYYHHRYSDDLDFFLNNDLHFL